MPCCARPLLQASAASVPTFPLASPDGRPSRRSNSARPRAAADVGPPSALAAGAAATGRSMGIGPNKGQQLDCALKAVRRRAAAAQPIEGQDRGIAQLLCCGMSAGGLCLQYCSR